MVKVFLLLMVVSIPNSPSVKYNALLYPNIEECMVARDGYMATYDSRDQDYKDKLITHAICLEFETFPVQGLPAEPTGLGAQMAKKWIQKAKLKKGALRKDLGVPAGKKIPKSKLKAAAKKKGTIGKRARLAMTFSKMKKK